MAAAVGLCLLLVPKLLYPVAEETYRAFFRSVRRVAARHRPVACATRPSGRGCFEVRVQCSKVVRHAGTRSTVEFGFKALFPGGWKAAAPAFIS